MAKYQIKCKNKVLGPHIKEVEGEPIELMEGYEFFIHEAAFDEDSKEEDDSGFTVTEVSTGYACGSGTLKETAIAKARFNLERHREFFIEEVKKAIERNKELFPETERAK